MPVGLRVKVASTTESSRVDQHEIDVKTSRSNASLRFTWHMLPMCHRCAGHKGGSSTNYPQMSHIFLKWLIMWAEGTRKRLMMAQSNVELGFSKSQAPRCCHLHQLFSRQAYKSAIHIPDVFILALVHGGISPTDKIKCTSSSIFHSRIDDLGLH